MTPGESVELLFRCRTEGQAEVDSLAGSVRGVSAASVLASTDITGLERAIQALTGEVTKNTAALGGMATGADAAGAGLTRMAGGARTASNELRVLEGAMPIRAAAQFLTQFQAINTVMTAAFPVFGAIALVGVLDTIIGKVTEWANAHNPVIEAQKESLSLMEKAGKEYDKLAEKAHKRRLDEVEHTFGKPAREKMEADDYERASKQEDADQIAKLENLLGAVNRVATNYTSAKPFQRMSAEDVTLLKQAPYLLGMKQDEKGKYQELGLEDVTAGHIPTLSQTHSAKEFSVGLQDLLQATQMRQGGDVDSASDMRSKVSQDARKKADEEAKKRKQEVAENDKQVAALLRSAQTFELTGLERINAEYSEKIKLLGKTKENIADINAAFAIEVQRETAKEAVQGVQDSRAASDAQYSDKQIVAFATMQNTHRLAKASNASPDAEYTARMAEIEEERKLTADRLAADIADAEQIALIQGHRKEADKLIAAAQRKANHDNAEQQAEEIRANGDKELETIAAIKRAREELYKVLRAGDDSEANTVRRSVEATVHGNTTAVSMGRMTGQSAASGDYMARVSAAREIFQIETQHLDLIAEQGKHDEAYANARKKRDEEIYHAAEQYEIQLQNLREKDLQKYHEMAGSFFDAMHSHTTNQWFRSFAVGQEKEVFSNAVTPLIQNAGHMLGGVTGGFNPGGLLTGTVLDPANKGVDELQRKTVDNTKASADWLGKIYTTLSGQTASDPNSAMPPISGTGLQGWPLSAASNSILFGSGGLLGTGLGGGFGLGTGSGLGTSALFNAGGGSVLSQFFSGIGGGGDNPLGAIFGGMSTKGGTVTQLSGPQRAGVAVGTGAMLAGAGMTIASGISEGGAGGDLKAASGALGAASIIPGPQQPFVAAAAAITAVVSSLLSTGPQQRSTDIFNALSSNQYLSPTALNVIQGMNGTYEDFDARGNLRTSTMSAVPTVAEPYITSRVVDGSRTYYDVNGNVTSPYSGGAKGTGQAPVAGGVTINVGGNLQAMDSESFHEFVRRPANSHSVGEATADHLERHDGRLANAVRFIAG